MKQYLAFDIGGTHIKYGTVKENGEIISRSLVNTEAHLGGRSIIDKIIAVSKVMLNDYPDIIGIAISTAGQVNINTGVIIGAGETIPNYKGLDIKFLVSEALELPVEVRNDVDCTALGEKWMGGHHTEDFIALTVGTGVGGAIVINNELYSGHTFSAGEWGYMIIEGEPFEKTASISGLINFAKKYKGDREWTGKQVFELYDNGDIQIKEAIKSFYRHLAIGISNLIYIFNPEKVVVGGGITGRGELFLQELKQEVKKHLQLPFYQNTEIVLAQHSNNSGMLGAVYNFIQRQG